MLRLFLQCPISGRGQSNPSAFHSRKRLFSDARSPGARCPEKEGRMRLGRGSSKCVYVCVHTHTHTPPEERTPFQSPGTFYGSTDGVRTPKEPEVREL